MRIQYKTYEPCHFSDQTDFKFFPVKYSTEQTKVEEIAELQPRHSNQRPHRSTILQNFLRKINVRSQRQLVAKKGFVAKIPLSTRRISCSGIVLTDFLAAAYQNPSLHISRRLCLKYIN